MKTGQVSVATDRRADMRNRQNRMHPVEWVRCELSSGHARYLSGPADWRSRRCAAGGGLPRRSRTPRTPLRPSERFGVEPQPGRCKAWLGNEDDPSSLDIGWQGRLRRGSFAGAMADETIGLEEVGDGLWSIV